MALIRLEDIDKNFPGVRALSNINLEIKSGEFFTLLGPSGCGKTTLLRIVAGFYKQDKGHVYIGSKLVDTVPAYLRDTGMVFQNYAVWPHMTVYENVAFGLQNRKIRASVIRERVSRVLKMARLTGYEERTPDQLSGGQQQRVGLARAMVIEPQGLLMDEPLSNLDAKLRLEMREEIRDIQRQLGITTIYVTHDQEEALVISDRIAVMNEGIIQQVGKPWDIYKNPVDTFVASFVGHTNFIDGKVVSGSHAGIFEISVGKCTLKIKEPSRKKEKYRLAVRPEDLLIEPGKVQNNEEGFSSFSGKVVKSSFTGSVIQYFVECDNEIKLIVEKHKPERTALIPGGSKVSIKLPTEAILVFDPDTGERI